MTVSWQQMTIAEYATFESILGRRPIVMNGVYWTEVRPLFYRPLSPYQQVPSVQVRLPARSWLGGFQHAVPPGEDANSVINLLLFQDAESYSLKSLSDRHRREVKAAAKQVVIRPITDREEFKAVAYATYVSFYERTGYPFGSQRTQRDFFGWWADELFKVPKVVILGGFLKGQLGGISISALVDDTLRYPTVFCDTGSLQAHLPGYMLHFVRAAVAEQRCARQVFAGLCKTGAEQSVDQFYIQRGCQQVRLPARLRLNSLAAFGLKKFAPKKYHRFGDIHVGTSGPVHYQDLPAGNPGAGHAHEQARTTGSGRGNPL